MENTAALADNSSLAINKGKRYQIALFPFNNAATNCYLTLMTFIAYYFGGVVLAVANVAITTLISTVVMAMRIFDGVTDPILGSVMDKTRGRLGKFRIYIIIGQLMLMLSAVLIFFALRAFPGGEGMDGVRWTFFIIFYIIYVLGYTCQCACTKAGQNCITNDPQQRSQFIVWNLLGMLGSIVLVNMLGNGLLFTVVKSIYKARNPEINFNDPAQYPGTTYTPEFYNILVPIVMALSLIYTVLALIAIWKKDRPEFWGIDAKAESAKFKDYGRLIKENSQIRWLVFSAGSNKLASTIATSGTVAYMIYGSMMMAYDNLYIPIYVVSFFFMGFFFVWGSKTAGRKGQKRAIVQFTAIAFLFYIGLIILLLIWNPGNTNTWLSLFETGTDSWFFGITITVNLFTAFWVILYGCGYGAYNVVSEMCIPMVADCTDYELYRTGNYVPGIMGTIFSLIDKLMSSLSTLLIQLFTVVMLNLEGGLLPTAETPFVEGMNVSVLILFCLIPMTAWAITLFAMRFYRLSGKNIKEIQAVNAVRKTAIAGGMSKEAAMATWTTIDQVPEEFVYPDKPVINKKTGEEVKIKINWFDKIYDKLYAKHEKTTAAPPSSNAVQIPGEYLSGKDKILAAAAEANESLFKGISKNPRA